eukprot:scaffold107046_cov46-Prasinocladus_malaysianus.AAC.1
MLLAFYFKRVQDAEGGHVMSGRSEGVFPFDQIGLGPTSVEMFELCGKKIAQPCWQHRSEVGGEKPVFVKREFFHIRRGKSTV